MARNIGRANRRLEALGRLYRRTGNQAQREFVENGVRNLLRLNTALLAVDLATQGLSASFGTLGRAIGGALERETSEMQSINTVIQTLKLGANDAADFVQDFNKQIAITGQALPVSADKIRVFSNSIIDDYSEALAAAGAGAEQVKSVLLEDATRLAIAQASAGTSDGEAQAAIASLLSGGLTTRGFSQYKFFANNVALKNALTTAAEERGITSFRDISALDRIKILNQALEQAFPQESIDRLKTTGQAKISAFTDLLFGELGIFSLTRDLDESTRGYQSVYTSFKDTLDLVIGEQGVLAQLGSLSGLQSTSFGLGLRRAVEGFNNIIRDFSSAIEGVNNFGLGMAIGDLGADLVNAVAVGITDALAQTNWVAVADAFVGGVVGFFVNLDWRVYLAASGAAALVAVKPVIVGLAIKTIAVIAAAVAGAPVALAAAVVVGLVAVTKLVVDNWDAISSTVSDVLVTAKDFVINTVVRIGQMIRDLFDSILGGITNLFGNVEDGEKVTAPATHTISDTYEYSFGTGATGFLPAWAKEMRMAPSGSYPIIANSSEAILTQGQLGGLLSQNSQGGNSVNIGAINLNLPEGTPIEMAEQVLQILEKEIVQRMEAVI